MRSSFRVVIGREQPAGSERAASAATLERALRMGLRTVPRQPARSAFRVADVGPVAGAAVGFACRTALVPFTAGDHHGAWGLLPPGPTVGVAAKR